MATPGSEYVYPTADKPLDKRTLTPEYVELHCLSNFSFLRGASSARELFERAKALGYGALAITDEASMAGIVRAFEASRKTGLPLIVGSELQLAQGPKLVLLAQSLPGYQTLCRWITLGRRRVAKGSYRLTQADLAGDTSGLLALWVPGDEPVAAHGAWVEATFPQRSWIAVELHRGADDTRRLRQLQALGATLGLPLVAAGDVHMHARGRRALQDTVTAIRHRTTVREAGDRLFPNGERHLRRRELLAQAYPPELLAETLAVAARCRFTLDQLKYEYPREVVPEGQTPTGWLRELALDGARWRWPGGTPPEALAKIESELALIADLGYESYFLTVYDIVRFARSEGIVCQGRGSAANSVVCYALGITEVDPSRIGMLMERFISRERREPPDIDVDFDSTRREEVIQYVYRRYGRERAALTAIATTYSGRSTLRDVAKALGLAPDQVDRLARTLGRWDDALPAADRLREAGFDPDNPALRRVMALTAQLLDFPRHLSQHPGGFVISDAPLHTLVPVENAAMPDRTVIQWDKDDLDTLGLMKVDVLGIGMLGAIARCLQLLRDSGRRDLRLQDIPAEDPKVYAMIQRADTIGTFQIESRAQMAMLPRLKPACYYDLVVQVAIVRPGPIEGRMVHPYLQRRMGREAVMYPSPALEKVLSRTLGIPLFQEQVMQIAIVAAGYTPGEADQLRRSMAAWKRHGGLEPHRDRLLAGMRQRGYADEFAERIFEQVKGFGSYGFPESHAASYALVAYVSSWLKCHEPAAFACALVNTPTHMGFYTPDQLLQDARRHGIQVRPADVRYSDWDCSLEDSSAGSQPAIRIGLNQVRGFQQAVAERLMIARAREPFRHLDDLAHRAGLERRHLDLLAEADALRGLAGHRNRARWAAAGVETSLPLFAGLQASPEARIALPPPTAGESVLADYASTGTTLGPHPLRLVRRQLRAQRCRPSRELATLPHGAHIRHAGLVTLRQRPGTAKGVTFVTLEDEDGTVSVVIWKDLAQRQRRELANASLLAVDGRWEKVDGVSHLIAGRLHDLTPLLGALDVTSHDYY
ncbi:error-prone DNA polymerase [Arenimonas sp. MALMAid1274]|uniref:error-prone DNA polymerase n=1 Tax=Arenimonas sp. MALMAid1274 TaxID=3411630 RepID=UPI003B9EAFA3